MLRRLTACDRDTRASEAIDASLLMSPPPWPAQPQAGAAALLASRAGTGEAGRFLLGVPNRREKMGDP